jgi:anti-sigma regulatory factor (Ser/Thr protein kinase)
MLLPAALVIMVFNFGSFCSKLIRHAGLPLTWPWQIVVPVITDSLLRRNCVRHLSVVNFGSGPGRLSRSITLLPLAQAVAVARDWSRETLSTWKLGELADEVAQIVSELVTNSIEHADTARIRALLMRTPGTIFVNVADDDTLNLPACKQAGPDDICGRGLAIVEALSDRWGVTVAEEGKSVWCEVTLPRTPPFPH